MTRSILLAAFVFSAYAQDSRNIEIPNTDTHFKPRAYKTQAEWLARKAQLRKQILAAAGLLPMLPKMDLHAQVFGRIENRDYSVEKVLLETLPGYYLGGNLYRPLKPAPAGGYPAVVSPHGHWVQGRLENTEVVSVPARCINLAQQGYVVLAIDMVGYNDTVQTPHYFGNRAEQLWAFGPLGLQLWNSIRAVDFLESLPGVDPKRIGATGASGGGTQTFLLQAVDDRVQFSSPVNMISAIYQGGGLCENAPNLRIGTNNVEIGAMMAPKPMLMVSTSGDWSRNTATEEYPAIRAIYDLFDKASYVEMFFQTAPHNYNLKSREAVYGFFGKHVLKQDTAPKETPIRPFKLTDMMVLHNRTLPPNAVNYDQLVALWKRTSQNQTDAITNPAALREMMTLALAAEMPTRVESQTNGETVTLSRPGAGDRIPGVLLPGKAPAALVVHPQGAEAARKSREVADLVRAGRKVLLIDAFQTGTAVAPRNRSHRHFLTFNKSDDANRVQDILTALAYLNAPDVELVGLDEAGIWCLFAAAVWPRQVNLKANVSSFTGTDQEFLDRFFVPDIQRAGGLRAARLLAGR